MRVVLQWVSRAGDSIESGIARAIERGFCLLVGFTQNNSIVEVDWMAEAVAGLRLFSGAEEKLKLGSGTDPRSFLRAPHRAALRRGLRVETGDLGAAMQVEIHNDRPVTRVLDRHGAS